MLKKAKQYICSNLIVFYDWKSRTMKMNRMTLFFSSFFNKSVFLHSRNSVHSILTLYRFWLRSQTKRKKKHEKRPSYAERSLIYTYAMHKCMRLCGCIRLALVINISLSMTKTAVRCLFGITSLQWTRRAKEQLQRMRWKWCEHWNIVRRCVSDKQRERLALAWRQTVSFFFSFLVASAYFQHVMLLFLFWLVGHLSFFVASRRIVVHSYSILILMLTHSGNFLDNFLLHFFFVFVLAAAAISMTA